MEHPHRVSAFVGTACMCTIIISTFLVFSALEAVSLLGGEELQPFYSMLDGGRDGEFFTELEEYFYYAQIRRYVYTITRHTVSTTGSFSQGPDITSVRNVSTTILIEEIPNIMRALGFYPSEQEVSRVCCFHL